MQSWQEILATFELVVRARLICAKTGNKIMDIKEILSYPDSHSFYATFAQVNGVLDSSGSRYVLQT